MKDIKDIKEVMPLQDGTDASTVGYAAIANAMPATQEAAPFLGKAYASGSCTQDELAEGMVEAGCQMPVAEIKRVWNGTGAYLIETMPMAPRVFDIGFVRLWPSLGGTFDSADGEFDASRNTLTVAAAPSATIRTALSGGTPYRTSDAGLDPAIGNVTWNNTANTIKSGEPFTIIGKYLTRGVGDEYAELKLPGDGGTVPVTLETQVSADDGCQRLIGSLEHAVDACDGAVLTVYTHGENPSSTRRPVSSDKLTVLASDSPVTPAPDLTEIHSFGHGEDTEHIYEGASVELIGTALNGATVKVERLEGVWKDEVTIPADKLEVTDTKIVIDGEWLDEEYAIPKDVAIGDSVRFTVTTPGGSDMIASIWAENE